MLEIMRVSFSRIEWNLFENVRVNISIEDDEKYLHGPEAPRDCVPSQSCKCIVHEIVC